MDAVLEAGASLLGSRQQGDMETEPVLVAQPMANASSAPTRAANPFLKLLEIAIERGSDISLLQKLMDLAECHEQRAREAEQAFNAARSLLASKAITVLKTKKSEGYSHAELHGFVDALGEAMHECGLSYSWSIKQEKDWVWVTCTLRHTLGASDSVAVGGPPDASGNKVGVYQVLSTITLLERHTLKAVTGTAEKGDDTDGHTDEAAFSQGPQADQIDHKKALTEAKTPQDLSRVMNGIPKDIRKNFLSVFKDCMAKLSEGASA